MNIKIGQKVIVPKDLLGLFGGVHTQIAIGTNVLTVEQASSDWIVFRDESNSPWYINFDRPGYVYEIRKQIKTLAVIAITSSM